MAKSDLLKEAIADAKAVKETAIANAKLALQEAFAPRIQSALSLSLSEQLEDEEEGMEDMEAGMEDMEAGEAEMEMGAEEMGSPESVGVGLDFDADGEYDLTGTLGAEEEGEEGMEDMEMGAEEMEAGEAEMEMGADEEDLDLAEIIRELEEGMYEEEMPAEDEMMPEGDYSAEEDEDIDSIIEAILREEEEEEEEEEVTENVAMEAELNEAYSTIKQLRSVINEVNLLNAKLLYTNKLFRNFELNDSQKMKVIENFDRAANTREVKLVFSTLAESFKKPTVKRVVKESYASKPTRTTAPSPESKQIISEGNELANRWKKLAGLL